MYVVPRADLFFHYDFGKGKPVVGLAASYSPLISSLEGVKTRNAFAFGPTFGLHSFTDQVVFGIMNEFVQNNDGEYKHILSFRASFPIKFE